MDNISRIMEAIRKKLKRQNYIIEIKNAFGELKSRLDMVEEISVSSKMCQ